MSCLMAMPVLVINMLGEMVYILEERLKSQGLPDEKRSRVVTDILNCLFDVKFTAELFRPQLLPTHAAARPIFDGFAQSSIIKLSQVSMDKLYELMTMSFKCQVMSCTYPGELMLLSVNHLKYMSQALGPLGVSENVASFIKLFNRTFSSWNAGRWLQLYQTLCAFLQDRRTKVSLFLEEGWQRKSGQIVLPTGCPLPPGVRTPGKIIYFENDRESGTDKFTYQGCVGKRLSSVPTSLLGANIFEKRKAAASLESEPDGANEPFSDSSATQSHEKKAAVAELSLLARLIAPSPAVVGHDGVSPHDAGSVFKPLYSLNLFDEGPPFDDTDGRQARTITLNAAKQDDLHRLMHDFSNVPSTGKPSTEVKSEVDDLLDLLDSSAI